jgi:hypothetical protein
MDGPPVANQDFRTSACRKSRIRIAAIAKACRYLQFAVDERRTASPIQFPLAPGHTGPRPRGAIRPSDASYFRAQRARGMPGARRTRSLACKWVVSTRASSPQVHRIHPAFPHAMVLTVSFGLSLVIGLSCHHRLRIGNAGPGRADMPPQNLTPASRRQDHTTSPSAKSAVRRRAINGSRGNPALPSHRAL